MPRRGSPIDGLLRALAGDHQHHATAAVMGRVDEMGKPRARLALAQAVL
jgi:hypothetical protein